MISQRQLYSFRRFVNLLITSAEQAHGHSLAEQDRMFLALQLEERTIRVVDKFVLGAKKHSDVPIVERVTLKDIAEELYDADFYLAALSEKLRIANARLTQQTGI